MSKQLRQMILDGDDPVKVAQIIADGINGTENKPDKPFASRYIEAADMTRPLGGLGLLDALAPDDDYWKKVRTQVDRLIGAG